MSANILLELLVDGVWVRGVAVFSDDADSLIAYWPPSLASSLPLQVLELGHILEKPGDYLVTRCRGSKFALLRTQNRLLLLVLAKRAKAEDILHHLYKTITHLQRYRAPRTRAESFRYGEG